MSESAKRRHEQALAYIEAHRHASVADLVSRLGVSPITVRRDLALLAERKLITRVYGGVVPLGAGAGGPDLGVENSLRLADNVEEKQRVARLAAAEAKDGDIVFVDAGSSCFYVAQALKDKRVVVVTHSLTAINFLKRIPTIRLIALNGEYNRVLDAFVGLDDPFLSRGVVIDVAFLGATAFDPKRGCFDETFVEKETKNRVNDLARRSFLVIDSRKTTVSAPYLSIPIEKVRNVVTSAAMPGRDAFEAALKARNIAVGFA